MTTKFKLFLFYYLTLYRYEYATGQFVALKDVGIRVVRLNKEYIKRYPFLAMIFVSMPEYAERRTSKELVRNS